MGEAARRVALTCCIAACVAGCARSEAQVQWDGDYVAAQHELAAGDFDAAAVDLRALAAEAPRPVDAAAAARDAAAALELGGDPERALRVYLAESEGAARRPDRARAHYALARFAEHSGRLERAIELYRAIVRTYPDLMPGERSLSHLERLFEAQGAPGVEAHLAWTRAIYPDLAHTSLGDNLVFYAARQAFKRFIASGARADADLAERLYLQIHSAHPGSGLWNDAWWHLSWLYHREARYQDEILAIRRIQRTRQKISLFGHDEHPYFWQGQFRVARLQLRDLADPDAAALSYDWFIENYPDSIWLDDALFWRGCALLQAGRPEDAAASFDKIATVRPDGSKYLDRIPLAEADPRGAVCDPRDFTGEDLE